MTARAWLDTIRSKGASVTVDGEGRIVIEPDVLTDDEATELATLKPAVLPLLTGGGTPATPHRALSSPSPSERMWHDLRAAVMADREGRS